MGRLCQCQGCGYLFEDELGKYGCPNCEADMIEPTDWRNAVIKPTVGRVVWYWPTLNEPLNKLDTRQPLAAIIAYVHDEQRINVTVFDHTGMPYGRKSIYLSQDNEPDPPILPYASWMPIGQAAKTAEAEAKAEANL